MSQSHLFDNHGPRRQQHFIGRKDGYTVLGGRQVSFGWFIVAAIISAAAIAGLVLGAIAVSWGKHDVPDPLEISDFKVTNMLDTSTSHVLPAPIFIVVGQGEPGVEDWPESVLGKKRNTLQYIPVFPSIVPNIPLPPPDAVFVDTIKEALEFLQGKVITNTTILLRAGTYNENVVLDGFTSNCGGTLSADIQDNVGEIRCRGLNFIGDARFIAGYSYMHGALSDAKGGPHPAIGSDGSVANLICINSTAIRVERPGVPGATLLDNDPDFEVLGVVPGDKIVIGNGVTKASSDKTVTGVSGNEIAFSTSGCDIDGPGSILTFLPNRIIKAQAPTGTGTSPIPPAELLQAVGAGFNIQQTANVVGLYVKSPDGPNALMWTVCSFGGHKPFISGVVCDNRATTTLSFNALFVSASGRTGIFGPNKVQDSPFGLDFYNNTSSNNFLQLIDYYGHITVLGGQANFFGANYRLSTLSTFGGYFLAERGANLHISNIQASGTPASFHTCRLQQASKVYTDAANCFGRTNGVSSGMRIQHSSHWEHGSLGFNIKATGFCVLTEERSSLSVIANSNQAAWLPQKIFTLDTCPTAFKLEDASSVRMGVTPTFANGAGSSAQYSQNSDNVELTIGLNRKFDSETISNDGSINPDRSVQYLDGTGPRDMTLSATELAEMVNRHFTILSKTDEAHNITLTGGAEWSSGNTIATWPGTAGTGLMFHVISSTLIAVTNNVGSVVFS